MEQFRLNLTDEDKRYLRDLALLSITGWLTGKTPAAIPQPPSELLKTELGAFVTLKRRDQLRGCIGNVTGHGPLYQTVWNMAQAAAFQDPRFRPLERAELEGLEMEISVLGPVEPCPDPAQIEVGRHGLIMCRGARQGLLLPQVPVEWGWDREQFLAQTCRKAGLPASAWRDPDTTIYWFEAVVF
jgi:AmmeMemoRadiSam system protein A